MKRIFIALKVEPGEALMNMVSTFKTVLTDDSIKWVSMSNIHITLAFIGDTEEKMIKAISAMLESKCQGTGRFELIMKGAGVFRNPADPRIIWTGIEPSDKLLQLNEIIVNGLNELNIKLEDRPFKPHLTLGRIKHLSDREKLKSLTDKYQNNQLQVIPANEVILYESVLLPAGPVYKAISKTDLG